MKVKSNIKKKEGNVFPSLQPASRFFATPSPRGLRPLKPRGYTLFCKQQSLCIKISLTITILKNCERKSVSACCKVTYCCKV